MSKKEIIMQVATAMTACDCYLRHLEQEGETNKQPYNVEQEDKATYALRSFQDNYLLVESVFDATRNAYFDKDFIDRIILEKNEDQE